MCQINQVLGKPGRMVHSLARGIHNRRLDKSYIDLWINEVSDEPVSDKTDVTVTRVLSDAFKATRKLTTWDNCIIIIIANYINTYIHVCYVCMYIHACTCTHIATVDDN